MKRRERLGRIGLAAATAASSIVAVGAVAVVVPQGVASAMPPATWSYPADYSIVAPDCFGLTTAADCQVFGDDLYEQPTSAASGSYTPALDIEQTALGFDADFVYVAVDLRGSVGLLADEKYAFEFDVDNDDKPDGALYSTEPENLPAGQWGQTGILAAFDQNGDVGGADIFVAGDGVAGADGYEAPIPIGNDLFVRRIGDRIEIAVRRANAVFPIDPATVQVRAVATDAQVGPEFALANDLIPGEAFVTSVDNSAGIGNFLTLQPPVGVAGIGGVPDGQSTNPSVPESFNVLANDDIIWPLSDIELIAVESTSLFSRTVVNNGGVNCQFGDGDCGLVTYDTSADAFSSGVPDSFFYTLRNTVTGEEQMVKVTLYLNPTPIDQADVIASVRSNEGAIVIENCGVNMTIERTLEASTPTGAGVSNFLNIDVVDTGTGPPNSTLPGIHLSPQFNGAGTGLNALDQGEPSAITLFFSRPIASLSLNFHAQQAEEIIEFSIPATSIEPQLNSTFGVAPSITSDVELAAGNTQLVSNFTAPFGTTSSEAFGSNSLVRWDFGPAGATELRIDHLGAGTSALVPANGPTTHNGTIVALGDVGCGEVIDEIAVAKRVQNDPTPNADGTYTVTYIYEVENSGTTELANISVVDDFTAPGRFGTYVAGTPTNPGEYTTTTPQVDFGVVDGPTPNASFTGDPTTPNDGADLFDQTRAPLPGTDPRPRDNPPFPEFTQGRLLPGETEEIEVTVTFFPDFQGATTLTIPNNAEANAEGFNPCLDGERIDFGFFVSDACEQYARADPGSATVPGDTSTSDISTDGPETDPNFDDDPREQEPTIIEVGILNPELSIEKDLGSNADGDGDGRVSSGDVLTYEFAVTNTGNVAISAMFVTDPLITNAPNSETITCPTTTLQPGDTVTCEGDYTVVTSDVDTGVIDNTAFATGTPDLPPGAPPVFSPPDVKSVGVLQSPGILLTKTASPNGTLDFDDNDNSGSLTIGDDVNYTFTIENIGDTTLTSVTLEDDKLAAYAAATQCGALTVLLPTETTTCMGSYEVTGADIGPGVTIDNTATARAVPPGTTEVPEVTSVDDETVTPTANPGIRLTKSLASTSDVDNDGLISAGDLANYEFLIENTGDTPLSNVVLTDALITGTDNAVALRSLDCGGNDALTVAPNAGSSFTCTASFELRQSDIDTGRLDNTADVAAEPPSGLPPVTSNDPEILLLPADPELTLTKELSSTAPTNPQVGDELEFTYVIENTGNVTLDSFTFEDDQIGTYPQGNVASPAAPFLSCVDANAAVIAAGASLAPGTVLTCTGLYELTTNDLNAAEVTNIATTSGTPPGLPPTPVSPPPVDVTVPLPQNPALTVVKSAASIAPTPAALNSVITYEFLVTNTGNVTLTDVGVTDDKITGTIACNDTQLDPGTNTTCSGNYIVTQPDVDAGSVDNIGTASGTPPPPPGTPPGTPNPPITVDDPHSEPIAQLPSILLDKQFTGFSGRADADADGDGQIEAGDEIAYSFEIANNGNVTLTGVSLTDSKIPFGSPSSVFALTGPCGSTLGAPNTTLAPGDTTTCTGIYQVTTDDLVNGVIDNTATATGTPVCCGDVTSIDNERVVPQENPSISIVKTQNGFAAGGDTDADGQIDVSDVINYDFLVTNDGDVPLTAVAVTDPLITDAPNSGTIDCTGLPDPLTVGGTHTCTASYTVVPGDVNAGIINNTAGVTGTSPPGTVVIDDDPEVTSIAQNPSIDLDKSFSSIVMDNGIGATGPTDAGLLDVIEYSFVVTNTGNVTLSNVTVTDPTITDAPNSGTIDCGGGVGVENVIPTDLAPGAANAVTCTGQYTVTAADVAAGEIINTATATGTPPMGPPVVSIDIETVRPSQNPSIDIDKVIIDQAPDVGAGALPGAVGDTITYQLTITNTGDVELTGVTVTDVVVADPANPGTPLTPDCGTIPDPFPAGDDFTCTVDYPLTQGDVDNGGIENTASVEGQPPVVGGMPPAVVVDEDPEPLTPLGNPGISITKSLINPPTPTVETSVLNYEIVVTNTGDQTLSDVTVTDTLVADLDCDPVAPGNQATIASLAPAAAFTCTASYKVQATDIAAGSVPNTASVEGQPPTPPGATTPPPKVIDDDPEVITPQQNPSIQLVKKAGAPVDVDNSGNATPNDTIEYTFTVTNTGDVTLSDVVLDDPALAVSVTPDCGVAGAANPNEIGTMAPLAIVTCTATYPVDQVDINDGRKFNRATVSGNPPVGPPVTSVATATVPLPPDPALDLVKSIQGAPFAVDPIAGATITYQFDVTNTGNVELTNLLVSDPLVGLSEPSCDATTLAPTASTVCTATYQVTQNDIDVLERDNVAIATGTPPTPTPTPPTPEDPFPVPVQPTTPPISPPSEALLPFAGDPEITLVKSVQGGTPDPTTIAVDDVLTYEFLVTNTGDVTLADIRVEDALDGLSAIVCPVATLAPATATTAAGSTNCTATYTVTQADVDAQIIPNVATAYGTPPIPADPADPEVSSLPSPVDVPITPELSITLVKSVQGGIPAVVAKDDVITYEFLVTNTSSVTLTDVTVNDALVGLSAVACPVTTLVPDGSTTCTATYTITQDDVDAAVRDNTATATGTPPAPPTGPPLTRPVSPPSDVSIPIPPTPMLTIDKDVQGGAPETIAAGDTVTYTFLVTNTGNQTLTGVAIDDPLPGLPTPTCPSTSLDPGASTTCTAVYTITEADVADLSVTNTAIATGQPPTPPGGTQPPRTQSPPDSVTVPAIADLGVAKRVLTGPTNVEGEPGAYLVTYDIDAVNAGTVVLSALQLTEDLSATFSGATSFEVVSTSSTDFAVNTAFNGTSDTDLLAGTDSLPVAEGGSVELVVKVTPGANTGPYLNSVTGTATPPSGPPETDISDSGTFGCNSPCTSTNADDIHAGEPGDMGTADDPTPVEFPSFDLALGKDLNVGASAAGIAVFDLTVSNSGNESAFAPIVVRDDLPAELSFISAVTPAGWSCAGIDDGVTCTGSNAMQPGDSITVSVTTRIAPGATSVVNTARVVSVAGITAETSQTNNEDSAAVPVGLLPDTGSNGVLNVVRTAAVLALFGGFLWLISRRRSRLRITQSS